MLKFSLGFWVGWALAFSFAGGTASVATDKTAGKTFTCVAGDSFLTRKKYLCNEAEFARQNAPANVPALPQGPAR